MLLNPSILALIMVSGVVSLMMLLAVGFSLQVLRRWDVSSGSELQLNLERRTYLISTILSFSFVAELISLLLFIYNAEQMSGRFVGAMCATGVLNINAWGWPALYLKIAVFFSGAAWLTLNRIDNMSSDYPLVRVKYGLLMLILPLVIAETVVQLVYFLQMEPDVITSCCGALFSPEGEGVAAEVSSLEPATALFMLLVAGGLNFIVGFWYLLRRSGGVVFAVSNVVVFLLALIAIVSCIALYIYEHPHHHCPFCILKSGHDYVGYALYIPLFLATAMAVSAGLISIFAHIDSLSDIIAQEGRRLVIRAMIWMVLFYLVAGWSIYASSLTMMGVWWS